MEARGTKRGSQRERTTFEKGSVEEPVCLQLGSLRSLLEQCCSAQANTTETPSCQVSHQQQAPPAASNPRVPAPSKTPPLPLSGPATCTECSGSDTLCKAAYWSPVLPGQSQSRSLAPAFSCILVHSHAFSCILTHSHAFSCLLMHSHAFSSSLRQSQLLRKARPLPVSIPAP